MPYLDTGRVSLFVEDAGSGGIPVLLLHELGGSSESWPEVISELAANRRVIAPDLRCAGRSEKPPGAFALADAADALDALLSALSPAGPVDVIGAASARWSERYWRSAIPPGCGGWSCARWRPTWPGRPARM